jgi:hypothetical protein
MNIEIPASLQDGQTRFPGELIINKMGSSVVLDFRVRLSLKGQKPIEKSVENDTIDQSEIDS